MIEEKEEEEEEALIFGDPSTIYFNNSLFDKNTN